MSAEEHTENKQREDGAAYKDEEDFEEPQFWPSMDSEKFRKGLFAISKQAQPEPAKEFDFRTIAHPSFFIVVLMMGVIIAYRSTTDKEGVVGNMLFLAGLTPTIIYFWSFLLGYGLRRRYDLLRVAVASIIMIAGVSIMRGESLYETFGIGLFEIGALFFIEKFFFLVSDDEKIIKILREELAEARKSPGTGMAMSYYYNFILPTASCLTGDAKTPQGVDMEISRGKFEDYTLKNDALLYVFIPRTVNETDLKKELSSGQRSGALRMGKPKAPAGQEGHRPMFMYFLSASEEDKTCQFMFDVPTIISACWNRYLDNSSKLPEKLLDSKLEASIPREIVDFQNELLSLVESHQETKNTVRLVSIPPPPIDFKRINKVLSFEIRKESVQDVAANPVYNTTMEQDKEK
eukprot:m.342597 g.342597  ORF g.342597 m.342597 type:complete len:405 (+) comp21600_c0_seq1:109-1323(+)